MDFFQVTHIWAEKSRGKICFKYRFEKMDLKSKSWWAPSNSPMPLQRRDRETKTPSQKCVSCKKESVQVYQQAWICLNETCVSFWTVNGGEPPAGLTYNPAFLSERSRWPKQARRPSFALKPAPFKADSGHADLECSIAGWKGFVCPNCGRCNSRILWRELSCDNKTCPFVQAVQLTPVPSSAVLTHRGTEIVGTAVPGADWNEVVAPKFEFHKHWRVNTFELSTGNVVTHYQANGQLNHAAGGADDLFQAVQGAEMGLQRFPLTSSPSELSWHSFLTNTEQISVKGELLTKHFASNFVSGLFQLF